MHFGSDHSVKFRLRPAVLPNRLDIPHSHQDCQLGLQNVVILEAELTVQEGLWYIWAVA